MLSLSSCRLRRFGLLVLLLAAVAVRAQQVTPTPTPFVDLSEDPWDRWVKQYYEIVQVEKDSVVRLEGNLAKPHPRINAVMEIVGEDEKFVYLRNLPLEDPRSAGHKAWLLRQGREAQLRMREEDFAKLYLIPREGIEAPRYVEKLRFVPENRGLPTSGRWQMGFDAADCNGDGLVDLVLPPARMGEAHPWIYLRQQDGWKSWEAVRWPQEVSFDYGDVAVADFDGDGNLDLALACHFKSNYVLYGDGRGGFTRWVELPRAHQSVTSRALAVADWNRDGRQDLVALAELDIDLNTKQAVTSGLIQVFLNTKEGWELSPATFPANIYGDQVAVGDFNGDKAPDILVASHKLGNQNFLFLNDGKGKSFTPYVSGAFPAQIFVFGVGAGRLGGGAKGDTAFLAVYQSVRPKEGEHLFAHAILGYTLTDAKGKLLAEPRRTVVYADQNPVTDSFRSIAVADVDGDGREDVVAARASGNILVLLQMPDGGFALEKAALGIPGGSPSTVGVYRWGKDTYIVANFSDEGQVPGGVQVWRVAKAAR
ncbi:MAG: FG-GAP repeat domain-containing protein [Thermoanaerobaculaceae bacterium]